jgi:spore maturation protein CgeB
MFEALASKCILLQYDDPDWHLGEIGFTEKTCYLFKTEQELREKYKYIIDHLDEAKKVAQNGYNLVNAMHGYVQRAIMFLLFAFYIKNKYFKK